MHSMRCGRVSGISCRGLAAANVSLESTRPREAKKAAVLACTSTKTRKVRSFARAVQQDDFLVLALMAPLSKVHALFAPVENISLPVPRTVYPGSPYARDCPAGWYTTGTSLESNCNQCPAGFMMTTSQDGCDHCQRASMGKTDYHAMNVPKNFSSRILAQHPVTNVIAQPHQAQIPVWVVLQASSRQTLETLIQIFRSAKFVRTAFSPA